MLYLRMFYKGLMAFGIVIMLGLGSGLESQTITVSQGSYIINMGVTPQTVDNGLRPYGLVYEMLKDYQVPVIWSINPNKMKDGIDFSHNGVDYRGGTFIIPAEFRSPAVNSRITHWQGQGVVGATTVSEITVPFYTEIKSVPKWTLDKKNGSIAAGYFVRAGIPPSAHGGSSSSNWKDPAELDCCDVIFAMPHADPVWSTHARLLSWNAPKTENNGCKGAIWAACHAVGYLENMVNPGNRSQQTNFLATKDPAWTGTSGSYALSNSTMTTKDHGNGSPPYTFNNNFAADPVGQFLGTFDAATTNGSEQIYIPRQGIVANPRTFNANAIARWNPGTNIIVYDPTQADVTNPDLNTLKNVAAVLLYGRGLDNPERGFVNYLAGHSHNKSTGPANIAAMRTFFNFGFLVAADNVFEAQISAPPAFVASGGSETFTVEVDPSGSYTVSWISSCGGSFSPNNQTQSGTSFSTTYTAPVVNQPTPCNISVSIIDQCGLQRNENTSVIIDNCELSFTNTINNISCNGLSDGSIEMSISGSDGPFSWSWNRISIPTGSGSGTGTTISNLSPGSYQVTVTDGGNCSGTFTQLINQPNPLLATPTVTNFLCFGQTGSINLAVNGGTTPYQYIWIGPMGFSSGNKDLTGLNAGNYLVTVTDDNMCSTTALATVTGPLTELSVSLVGKTDVLCNGASNGSFNINVAGGTPGYSFLWNDGSTLQNRTGLAAGNYSVTVTDANNCTAVLTESIAQPAPLVLSFTKIDPTCPPGADPSILGSNGSIDITVTGGTAPYTYDWADLTPPPVEPEDRYDLPAGTYTIVVSDTNGCTANISVTLTEQNPLVSPPTFIIKN
jgi:hypothetical protein